MANSKIETQEQTLKRVKDTIAVLNGYIAWWDIPLKDESMYELQVNILFHQERLKIEAPNGRVLPEFYFFIQKKYVNPVICQSHFLNLKNKRLGFLLLGRNVSLV